MAKHLSESQLAPAICLTPLEVNSPGIVKLAVFEFLAYSQNEGFTRLRLVGGKTLDVKETTERIDYLIRCACAG